MAVGKLKKTVTVIILVGAVFFSFRLVGHALPDGLVEDGGTREALVVPTGRITKLEEGFSVVSFRGDDGLEAFLRRGGASRDSQVAGFISGYLSGRSRDLPFKTTVGGCSTISATGHDGSAMFGRNFDWRPCYAMVVLASPSDGFASISTVNMDFLGTASRLLSFLPDEDSAFAALYAPMDGMNEKGLCVAVLMIQDHDMVDQNTERPDITTTTAIRLLLDRAADVDEAVTLLSEYDMHSSMGLMVHFALSDSTGKSVVVEYVDDHMVATETPVATNFYFAEGAKKGIGTAQSHVRYRSLMELLAERDGTMDHAGMRDALSSVGKRNFDDGETTEWSVVYDQGSGEVRYYHRENYDKGYLFHVPLYGEGRL